MKLRNLLEVLGIKKHREQELRILKVEESKDEKGHVDMTILGYDGREIVYRMASHEYTISARLSQRRARRVA
ncbi:MAG: hypothetical protein AABX71_00450 [Nanoarchaeota archaeon]